jgi:hypothetical protein
MGSAAAKHAIVRFLTSKPFCRSVSKNALNGWANDVVKGDGETSIRGHIAVIAVIGPRAFS